MTNIAYKKIFSAGDYVDLEEEMNIALTEGSEYQIQIINRAMFCIADSKPSEGGFYIENIKPFPYTHKGNKLWLKTVGLEPNTVNIHENPAEDDEPADAEL